MTRKARLSKRTVDAATPETSQYTVWDTELKGFGLRVMPSGVKAYYIQYRPRDASWKTPPRRFNIGRHGTLTPEEARQRADDALRAVRDGADPQEQKAARREEPTVDDLWTLYRREGCDLKKPSTLRTDLARYNSHIRPLLGKRRISTIEKADTEQLLKDIARGKTAVAKARTGKGQALRAGRATGGKGTATRTVGLFGALFTFAASHPETKRFITDHPVTGVKRFKDNKWQRHLNTEELTRLGALIEASADNRKAINIILTLALTGARKSEIESLPRTAFAPHLRHLQLGDSKSGYKFISLGPAALDLLLSVDMTEPSPYMFPATDNPARHFVGTYKIWRRIREAAGIPDVRLHDLRHTFASTGIMSSGNLAMIGKLLGHKDVKTTQQYAHIADTPMRQAADDADRITARALGLMAAEPLTDDQVQKARAMAGLGLEVAAIARALIATPEQIAEALAQA